MRAGGDGGGAIELQPAPMAESAAHRGYVRRRFSPLLVAINSLAIIPRPLGPSPYASTGLDQAPSSRTLHTAGALSHHSLLRMAKTARDR